MILTFLTLYSDELQCELLIISTLLVSDSLLESEDCRSGVGAHLYSQTQFSDDLQQRRHPANQLPDARVLQHPDYSNMQLSKHMIS